jgi:hypothetical protein
MFQYDKNKHKYFGECAIYENGEEKEAKEYLELWKKFLIRRLQRDSFSVNIVDEQWGNRPDNCLALRNCMYLKLCLEGVWKYEL